MTTTAAGRLAWSSVGLALVLAVAGRVLSLSGDGPEAESLAYDLSWWLLAASWAVVGALVASRQPRNPIGWILCGLTVFVGLIAVAEGYVDGYVAGRSDPGGLGDAAAWFAKAGSAWIPLVFVPLVFLPLFFPHGTLPSRRWRPVPYVAAAGIVAFWSSESFHAGPLYDHEQLENPYGIDHALIEVLGVGSLVVFASFVAAVVSLVVRFRRSTGTERQQLKWLAYAAALAVCAIGLAFVIGAFWSEHLANGFVIGAVLCVTAAMGIAILRHRLYDIDLLINRTLVYGSLTVAVVAIYVAIVGGLSAIVHERADFWLALVATGLVALLVQPLRSTLQRRVNRLTPGAPATGLRGRLVDAFAPEAAEVQRARERLVAAREEERRRLRRDLHDGLGPTLAGAALEIEAAENLLVSDPQTAAGLLEHAREGIQGAVADVRRLVYDLRPPALDELGLVGALREQALRLGAGNGLHVEVSATDDVPALPAAVEVAAYRIALEAVTNAARHADARRCHVTLSVNGGLLVEIADDGHGLPAALRAGVGITSMRERAEELGGSCELEPGLRGGTHVRALLPLGVE